MVGTLAKFAIALMLATPLVAAANLIVYDDQSENGFNDGCSFPAQPNPDFDFAFTATVHSGNDSIRFTPDNFNAISWCTPVTYSATTDYSAIDFWVNGGVAGGQNVDLVLGLGGNPVASASLTSLYGAPIPANTWVEIQASFVAALGYNGTFDQVSLQDESGVTQSIMYLDDVSLVAASALVSNYIFSDSFEPEYMFVPQYNQGGTGSIKVFQRTLNTSDFTLVNTATLPAGANPNAVSFAKDGGLWVVDDGNHELLRFTLQSVVGTSNPTPTASVGPVAGSPGLYDLAFFGDYAYASSDSGVLKYSVAAMTAGSNPAPTTFSSGGTPVGLAFDTQGRLWICNYGIPGNLVRMTTGGTIEVTISYGNIIDAEGLAFDEYGSLWFGNNSDNTLYGFGSQQITVDGSPTPIGQITTPSGVPIGGVHPTGYAGGIIFDRRGDLRANYEYDYTVRAYTIAATPSGGPYTSYASTELIPLTNATTDPGRGGIAIWPVPSTVPR
jgi:sugar lactone lactonase YvrE